MFGGIIAFALEHWTWLTPLLGAPLAAIPFAGPILVFLKANWKWALPLIGMALALAWAAVAQIGWERCTTARVQDQLAHKQAIIDQKDKDRKLSDEIITGQATTIAQLANKTNTHTEIIRNVPVTRECVQSPAMRAADDGLSDLGFKRAARPAPGVDAPKTGGAGARPR